MKTKTNNLKTFILYLD